jgi:hypothetical protein
MSIKLICDVCDTRTDNKFPRNGECYQLPDGWVRFSGDFDACGACIGKFKEFVKKAQS